MQWEKYKLVSHLREIMARHRINQRKLSELTGIRYATINDLYNDRAERINLNHLLKICVVLNCQPGELFEIVEVEEEKKKAPRF